VRTERSYPFNLSPMPAPQQYVFTRLHGVDETVLTVVTTATTPQLTCSDVTERDSAGSPAAHLATARIRLLSRQRPSAERLPTATIRQRNVPTTCQVEGHEQSKTTPSERSYLKGEYRVVHPE
jgi:hypothetical protein